MSERGIMAYFHSPEQAQGVASKLKALRVDTIQVDRISEYRQAGGAGMDHMMNPINGDFAGLGELVLDSDFGGPSARIMAAADPDASGLSGGDADMLGRDILLTAVVDESVYDQAMRVIEQSGGLV